MSDLVLSLVLGTIDMVVMFVDSMLAKKQERNNNDRKLNPKTDNLADKELLPLKLSESSNKQKKLNE